MKVFNASTMQAWDEYTISEEPISSINLMERAAIACVDWLCKKFESTTPFYIYCGKGNNGGDGLAIARLLTEKGFQVTVAVLEFGFKGSPDFQENLARLHYYPNVAVSFIQTEEHSKEIDSNAIIIDALFGTGINRPLEGLSASLVKKINTLNNTTVSIDIPSGLYLDKSSVGNDVIEADYTLTFQCLKPAFLVPENEHFIGEATVLNIGLHPSFEKHTVATYELLDLPLIHSFYKKRNQFSHKGNFGHALIIAGSEDKMGAAILSARACLKSGAGLVTAHIPSVGKTALNICCPEAMLSVDKDSICFSILPDNLTKYNSIGIGPGLGLDVKTSNAFQKLLSTLNKGTHLVIDADALNILSNKTSLLNELPPLSILTPHPKEFDRLFGVSKNDFERMEKAMVKAKELQIIIVVKGHHSFIATPFEQHYFNSTGNAGMATAGTGDVLTGIITGLIAQQYAPLHATLLGVFLHGLAGDLALTTQSMESLVASEIISHLGVAYKAL